MPYQGPAYTPPAGYGGNYEQNRQAPRPTGQGQARTNSDAQSQQYSYAMPATHYTTPQSDRQSNSYQQSFYETPLEYPQSTQQSHVSQPNWNTNQSNGYSPDPLSSYQPPLAAHRSSYTDNRTSQQQQQQQYQQVQQRRPPLQYSQHPTTAQSSVQPVRGAAQAPHRSEYSGQVQINTSSYDRNSHSSRQSSHQPQRPSVSQQNLQSGFSLPLPPNQQPSVRHQRLQTSSVHPSPQSQDRPQARTLSVSSSSSQLPQVQQKSQQPVGLQRSEHYSNPKQSRSPPLPPHTAPHAQRSGNVNGSQQIHVSNLVPQASARPTTHPRPLPDNTPARASPDAVQQRIAHVNIPHQIRQDPSSTTVNPNVLQRPVVRVEVPLQRNPLQSMQSPMSRSPKRRRSNEGKPIPVGRPPNMSQHQPDHARLQDNVPSSSPLTELTTSQIPPTPPPTNIDYQAVLLGLSDEYISVAYSMSASLSAADVSETDLDHYHSLLSTGMACLESVLQNYHITDSRREARIRLRLASLLYEETDNYVEAEEVLSKGLTVCDRARLPDLKYAMHHLIARLWFKSGKAKAAMKAIENHIIEVEKLNLVHWVYAFRFLRVSLGLRANNNLFETAALVKQLTAVAETASRQSHVAVQFVSATFEALVHLRSRTADSVDLAQRALTSARTHQLSREMEQMPQIRLLMDCVDLGCSLARFDQQQVATKLERMQRNMDDFASHAAWNSDGRWLLPVCTVSSNSPDIALDSADVFHMLEHDVYALTFKWLTKTQVHTLGFLLSGVAGLHKNTGHDQKAEQFLNEGFKLAKTAPEPLNQSMAAVSLQYAHQRIVRATIRLYVVFAACGRADWAKSLKGVTNIRQELADVEIVPDESIASLATYIEAIAKHGLGDLKNALKLYRSLDLKLDLGAESKPPCSNTSSLKVLAALNSILIMRLNGDEYAAAQLLYDLKPYCLTSKNSNGNEHGSKALESIFFTLKATEQRDETTENPIIQTKAFLQSAVNAAKSAVNNQLLCIVMNIMTDSFFQNIVGDQAMKSANASRSLAKKSKDPLWTAISAGMYADTLERCGKREDAEQARREAQEAVHRMPEPLKAALLDEKHDQ